MKYLIFLVALVGGYYWAANHYEVHHLHDTLDFAKKHPGPSLAPAIDYYAGLIYYQRAEYPQAQEAFTQLLSDYPTAQYMIKALPKLEDTAENNHDWESAKAACQQYIDQNPSGPDIDMMKQRLDLLNYHH